MTHPLDAYLRKMTAIHASGAGTAETSYYTPLENLLDAIGKSLSPRVRCVMQLADTGAGVPDGGLFSSDQFRRARDAKPLSNQLPARGAVEAKSLNASARKIAKSPQTQRYLERYGAVLVTTFREFVLVGLDRDGKRAQLETYTIAASEDEFWDAATNRKATVEEHGARLEEFLKRVMLRAAPLRAPEDVAWFLASYARDARMRIEASDLEALEVLRGSLETALGLKFEGEKGEHFFRSTLIQTLFYGVFSAWVLWARERGDRGDFFRWHETAWFLRVPMIRALFEQVAAPSKLKPLHIEEVLDWVEATLNRIDRPAFFSRFEERQAVQYFYEPFLAAFDPELRKRLGVWFTPAEIVTYMVQRIDASLRESLNIEDGLADERVVVLDPCTGTGSYLTEVLRQIHDTLSSKYGPDLAAQEVKKAALTRVFGFELLPAPFVVAHLQIGLMLRNVGAPLSDKKEERSAVFLTNSLTGWEPPDPDSERAYQASLRGFAELMDERTQASRVKREERILVVVGNPPYDGFAGVSPSEEAGLVDAYKVGLKDWKITKNYLDDLYVRFFRIAERRIAEYTKEGVVCFISNFSYLGDPSYVVMRERLLREFDELWIDCLNGDSRETGKRTPTGSPDPSVFSTTYNRAGIRKGTAIALLVRTKQHIPATEVRFRHFWGEDKRADLLKSLEERPFGTDYAQVEPQREDRYRFRPASVAPEYRSWPSLTDIAGAKPLLGLNENRAGGLQDIDRDVLEQRMRMYLDRSISWSAFERLATGLSRPAAGFNPREARRHVQSKEPFDQGRFVRYQRRPFDVGWAYISDVSPIWNRSRPELRKLVTGTSMFLVSRPARAASPEGVPLLATRVLGEQDMIRGHAYYFPTAASGTRQHRVRELQPALFTPVENSTTNLSASALAYARILNAGSGNDSLAAAPIWYHVLAICYSPNYLRDNDDGLRQDWPRIPLPGTGKRLAQSSECGRLISDLLDTESPVNGVTSGRLRPEARCIAVLTKSRTTMDLSVTAGWGYRTQAGIVMPGRGRAIERAYSREEREAIVQGARATNVSDDEAFEHLGGTTFDIYLNDSTFCANVPSGVWQYTIGGYQVLKKWLSYREEQLLGRPMTAAEVREFIDMVRRIAAIRLLEPALDRNYRAVANDAFPWSTSFSNPA